MGAIFSRVKHKVAQPHSFELSGGFLLSVPSDIQRPWKTKNKNSLKTTAQVRKLAPFDTKDVLHHFETCATNENRGFVFESPALNDISFEADGTPVVVFLFVYSV